MCRRIPGVERPGHRVQRPWLPLHPSPQYWVSSEDACGQHEDPCEHAGDDRCSLLGALVRHQHVLGAVEEAELVPAPDPLALDEVDRAPTTWGMLSAVVIAGVLRAMGDVHSVNWSQGDLLHTRATQVRADRQKQALVSPALGQAPKRRKRRTPQFSDGRPNDNLPVVWVLGPAPLSNEAALPIAHGTGTH